MTAYQPDIADLEACHGCDLLYEKASVPKGKKLRCSRCGTTLHIAMQNSLSKTLALSLSGLLLYIPAVTMPIMTFSVAGLHGSGNVIDAMMALFDRGYYFVCLMVLLVSIVFPLCKLLLLFIASLSLALGHVSRTVVLVFRLYRNLSEWGMVEVYMLGILVSIIKMYSMASIEYNVGIFCFLALVIVTVSTSVVVDEHLFWHLIEKRQDRPSPSATLIGYKKGKHVSARDMGLMRCHDCGKLSLSVSLANDEVARCPRCNAQLHSRKINSLSRTWALVLAAAIFYVPANILPMMRVNFMGSPDDSTILDGIIYFFQTGDYFVGGVILTASVLVPMFKIVGIILILLSVQFRWPGWMKHKAQMFRFIEFIGRWSFLDVFVIALLGAMVQFGSLTSIEADSAAPYFTAVVVSTMFAALAFDPRIMWDAIARPHSTRG